mgnify:CR=1 FL=1
MISIIVPCFNQHDATYECLTAVLENTQDMEIIVVDNGSTPPIKPPFSGFVEMRVIRNETNLGFPVAVNQGIREAKGDVIVLLNNDVVVTPGALNRLAGLLSDFSIIGPVTNYAAGLQRVQIESYENMDELNKAASALSEECSGDFEEVNFVIGFCMAFRKSLFDEIGPFDESLWPCSGEEIDLCFRARAAGYRIGIAQDVYVHHGESTTFRAMHEQKLLDYDEVCRKCDAHLAEKWGKDFWQKQAVTEKTTINVAPGEAIRLNLGCGYALQSGYVNIDNRAEVNPDLVCDVLEGLPYDDNSVDEVRAFDFLEHIPIGQTVNVISEIWRVLKPGGRFESFTPDAQHGQGAFQDPYHISFWVENSWLYFSDKASRDLYGTVADFEIESIKRVESGPDVFHLHVIGRARK